VILRFRIIQEETEKEKKKMVRGDMTKLPPSTD
jgi:hypothetical protein